MSVRERILTILLLNQIMEDPRRAEALGLEGTITAVSTDQDALTYSHA